MTDSAASKAAAAGTMPGPAIGNPIQRILVAKSLRDFRDGLVAVLLPAYLLARGFGAAEVGAVATLALLGTRGTLASQSGRSAQGLTTPSDLRAARQTQCASKCQAVRSF